MDWTDFDYDGPIDVALSLVTGPWPRHATAVVDSVEGGATRAGGTTFEDACLRRLGQELVPAGCRVTILADRGFGDHKLFAFLDDLGFGYVIRFRGNIRVTDADGTSKPAVEWVGRGGRARKLRDARYRERPSRRGQDVGC